MVKFLYYAVNETSPRILDKDLNDDKVFQQVCKSLVHNHAFYTSSGNKMTRFKYADGNILYYIVHNDNFLNDDTRPINECAMAALCGKARGFIDYPFIRDGVIIMKFKINGGEETFIDCEDIHDLIVLN